ncbi:MULTISPECIES: MBL fold metallo-hydrolase [Bacillus cereus group]|uniref:MBL fold metallo-hydrolase n=2 Tax=Bacillus cereus group TaxID=86661 RepID=A0AB73UFS0_BACCE|nr:MULTISPECIES: MBL fold metallo-hydrolase [Bacillus cereus group]MED3024746.1 MBL fold metallo-hydrolase [Bacillus wiedmannii]OTX97420.1 MBL fold metallo-hydrolase [Bacillus thuringiensis serovar wratislaviensis]OUB62093.1 MBL fold metallo-hydrolase [Bacillus thuringiensis serovar sylvestriensis]QHV07555.1 MBL fold metallo-hydrolase [Bacillus cereus]QHV43064.1 MBL fold metallo-hydrolase [Bacillus cereus]
MGNTYNIFQLKVSSGSIINYCYIVLDRISRKSAIVDPAWDLDIIEDKLVELQTIPTHILLTHSHYDHVNLVNPLVERYGSKVFMSAKEINFYKFDCHNLNELEDFETISLGNTLIQGILTPGHTAGGMSFLLSDSLFTGDTLFTEGCGLCDTFGGSPYEMFRSIQKIKKYVKPSVNIFPGHSYGKQPGLTFGHLLKNNIYCLFKDIDQFVAFRMRKNQKNLFDFQ